jgi:hypothetical protein
VPEVSPTPESLHELALSKVEKLVGESKARAVCDAALARASLTRIETADQLLRFADALHDQGGFLGAMGGVLRVKAILLGARP